MTFIKHEVEWSPEKVERVWDYYSANPAYNKLYFGFMRGKYVSRYIRENINLRKLDAIVDFGCGEGSLLAHIIPYLSEHQKVYGLGFSQHAVNLVNERFKDVPIFGGGEIGRLFCPLGRWRL